MWKSEKVICFVAWKTKSDLPIFNLANKKLQSHCLHFFKQNIIFLDKLIGYSVFWLVFNNNKNK